jgi:hypothetical protein
MTLSWRSGDIVDLDGRKLKLISYSPRIDRWTARNDRDEIVELNDLQMHSLRLIEGVRW